jgi:hypothetical protein
MVKTAAASLEEVFSRYSDEDFKMDDKHFSKFANSDLRSKELTGMELEAIFKKVKG